MKKIAVRVLAVYLVLLFEARVGIFGRVWNLGFGVTSDLLGCATRSICVIKDHWTGYDMDAEWAELQYPKKLWYSNLTKEEEASRVEFFYEMRARRPINTIRPSQRKATQYSSN
jgi:hypothetical protein